MKKALSILLMGACAIIFTATVTSCGSEDTPSSPESTIEITAVNPTVGVAGTSVTIYGNNFSSTKSENKVIFNGVPAEVSSATATELKTTVPEGAKTGALTVTTNGTSVQGPSFTVDNRLNLVGKYQTKEYSIRTSSFAVDTTFTVTKTTSIDLELVNGSSNEIEIEGFENFIQDGVNVAYSSMQGGSGFPVIFDKEATAEVDAGGDGFSLNRIKYSSTIGEITLEGSISGEGEMENGVVTITFQHKVTSSGGSSSSGSSASSFIIFSGEAEFERQEN